MSAYIENVWPEFESNKREGAHLIRLFSPSTALAPMGDMTCGPDGGKSRVPGTSGTFYHGSIVSCVLSPTIDDPLAECTVRHDPLAPQRSEWPRGEVTTAPSALEWNVSPATAF